MPIFDHKLSLLGLELQIVAYRWHPDRILSLFVLIWLISAEVALFVLGDLWCKMRWVFFLLLQYLLLLLKVNGWLSFYFIHTRLSYHVKYLFCWDSLQIDLSIPVHFSLVVLAVFWRRFVNLEDWIWLNGLCSTSITNLLELSNSLHPFGLHYLLWLLYQIILHAQMLLLMRWQLGELQPLGGNSVERLGSEQSSLWATSFAFGSWGLPCLVAWVFLLVHVRLEATTGFDKVLELVKRLAHSKVIWELNIFFLAERLHVYLERDMSASIWSINWDITIILLGNKFADQKCDTLASFIQPFGPRNVIEFINQVADVTFWNILRQHPDL